MIGLPLAPQITVMRFENKTMSTGLVLISISKIVATTELTAMLLNATPILASVNVIFWNDAPVLWFLHAGGEKSLRTGV